MELFIKFLSEFWDLTYLVGVVCVFFIAAFVLVKTTFKGDGIFHAFKKSLRILWNNWF